MTMQNPTDPFEGLRLNFWHPHIWKKVRDEKFPIAEFVFRRREWVCRFCTATRVKMKL